MSAAKPSKKHQLMDWILYYRNWLIVAFSIKTGK
jgi:hypothetical protein